MALTSYETRHKERAQEQVLPSGVACAERRCSGEMMYIVPKRKHSQLSLWRAACAACGWQGWC